MQSLDFDSCARLPLPGDNCAIATRRLESGTRIDQNGRSFLIRQPILIGHRFLVEPVGQGEPLLSWGLPFGFAERDIEPGEYLLNQAMATELALRDLDFDPGEANFRNDIRPFQLDEANLPAGRQVDRYDAGATFEGFRRPAGRGVGTRNYIAIVATNSNASSFVRLLQQRLGKLAQRSGSFDGVVAVAHTEGGSPQDPHNRQLLLRTLTGFLVHSNLGAVLAVDSDRGAVTNTSLRDALRDNQDPIDAIPHAFHTLGPNLEADLEQCAGVVRGWLPQVHSTQRSPQPLSELKVALQCGGSDAFSGISGNPLAGWLAREVVRHGGCANHAETDELIGAESYMLQNVAGVEVARKFLQAIERYKEMASWHGVSAEGNPSGGNKLRGLYNITLKSIGAAMKRNPDVRLDDVLDYGERMPGRGFFFMDSPGNDLESIAGQVASGANLILFTTGNGSITNFPFVPTLKMMTTTERFNLLPREMDVNAGAYLDGTSMDTLGRKTFDLVTQTVSGLLSKGEKAAHSQVSIWRNWMRTSSSGLVEKVERSFSRTPIDIGPAPAAPALEFLGVGSGSRMSVDQVGLILPTSLCAGQIALQIAARVESELQGGPVSRIVALPHSEGCGYSYGGGADLFVRSLLGHLAHPSVAAGMVLEHGCDKVHNGVLRDQLRRRGADTARYGWASIQLDGGIEKVSHKVHNWFRSALAALDTREAPTAFKNLSLGFVSDDSLSQPLAGAVWDVIRICHGAGSTVIVPADDRLLEVEAGLPEGMAATIEHGEAPEQAGFHIMDHSGRHWVEALTGLASSGAQLIVGVTQSARQGHPMVPVLQVGVGAGEESAGSDLDVVLSGDPEGWREEILSRIVDVASRRYHPAGLSSGNLDVQFTRGELGFSS